MTSAAPGRFSFLSKLAGAAALIGIADILFYGEEPGWTLGGFALAWMVALALLRPDVRRDGAALTALLSACGYGALLVYAPGPLAWLLFWTAAVSAALLPRRRFGHAAGWAVRLFVQSLLGLAAPLRDAARLARLRPGGSSGIAGAAALLALPVAGGAVFLALFASANPLIGNALAAIALPDLSSLVLHPALWTAVLLAVWPTLRPAGWRLGISGPRFDAGTRLPALPPATLLLSLVTFNAIFAIENALDLAFLWSGATLPAGVTLADYAHRGAYPLIATALLAAGFVLVAGRSDSRAVRRLIVLWVVQNVLLVASSILRTLDYIAAYSLTELRIAALAWMGLVAVGLVLIGWRMLTGRSAAWLVNANAAAATIVLTAAGASDLGSIAATWNVRHARSARDLDLCYLRRLGPSALLPLIELERRAAGPVLRDTAASLRQRALGRLAREQADWHSWSGRGAWRLALARERLGTRPHGPAVLRDCHGAVAAPKVD